MYVCHNTRSLVFDTSEILDAQFETKFKKNTINAMYLNIHSFIFDDRWHRLNSKVNDSLLQAPFTLC